MTWHAFDHQKLPQVTGKSFTKQEVILDGTSYQNCTFNECRIVYRGGAVRMTSCYVGPNCEWRFEDAAAYVLQFLQEVGWRIIPPAVLEQLRNQ